LEFLIFFNKSLTDKKLYNKLLLKIGVLVPAFGGRQAEIEPFEPDLGNASVGKTG